MAQERKNDVDETECQTPKGPILCASNCGFFGSSVTNNLCSKCYRDLVMTTQPAVPALPVQVAEKKHVVASSSVVFEPALIELEKIDQTLVANVDQSQPANKCMVCRKRVGLTGFKCRCGGTFCSGHRYSETHECSFDYKSAGRESIAKENPVVKADKIKKI